MGVWVRRSQSWMTSTGFRLCWRIAVCGGPSRGNTIGLEHAAVFRTGLELATGLRTSIHAT